jgi:hypothetical protein
MERAIQSIMSDRGGSRLRDGVALALIGAVALAVRMVFMRDWLNYDEAQHFLIAESPFWSDFVREFHQRAHPPFAYLAMKPFVLLGTSALWVRAVPMLAGLAGIGVAYALLRRTLASFWPAALGALVIGLLPLFVQQSIVARQYSLSLLFLWLALYFAAGVVSHKGRRFGDHAGLAAAQFAALMTEYTAVLAVLPLSAVIYLPRCVDLLRDQYRERRFARMGSFASLASLQLAVALSAFLLFRWHFQGSVPHFPHTEGDTYQAGLEAGAGPLLAYLGARIPRFVDGLIPLPWGVGLLVLAWLPLTPVFRGHRHARFARVAALVSLLGVVMLLSLAAAGALPLGGMPRHSVSLLPGLLTAALISCAIALDSWTAPGALRATVALGLVALTLPGFVKGWGRLSPHRDSYYELLARARIPQYREAPAPIVTNNRGRSLLSWYFFPDRPPRNVLHVPFLDHYDYDGIVVVETQSDRAMLENAIALAREHGEVWAVYSALELGSLKESYAYLKLGIRDDPHVRMQYSELSKGFVLPSILAVVERVEPER